MKNIIRSLFIVCLALVSPVTMASAEELETIFKRVGELVAAKNYPKAIEELTWANKELEKMHMQRLQSYIPDEVIGYAGQKTEANNAMGILALERNYTKAGAGSIKLELTGGSAGGAGAGGFGNLASIGRMAAMMGQNAPGQDTFRIGGRTATLNTSLRPELNIFLDSGSVLKLEGNNKTTGDALRQFAEAIKIDDLDNYLRGNAKS